MTVSKMTFPSEGRIGFGQRLAVIGVVVALLSTARPATAQLTQAPPAAARIEQKLGAQVPLNLTFRDESGQEVALGSFFGDKPVILTPVYYKCPMLCGLELNGLVRGLRALSLSPGEDFQIVTFSIDPREGSELAAEKRNQYLKQYGRDGTADGWRFLTGDQEEIDTLCKAVGFGKVFDEYSGEYVHSAGIIVCTPTGTISRYLLGIEFAPRDMKLAVLESSEEKVGSLADHVLLFCYRYDPTRGKYGLAILNLLRAGGILTVVILAGSVTVMLRRERHQLQEAEFVGGAVDG